MTTENSGTEKTTGAAVFGMAAGRGSIVTEDFECCIRDGQTGREIRFIADEDERARLQAQDGYDVFDTWLEIVAARYGA